MANLIMEHVSKCDYLTKQSIELSLIIYTEKLGHIIIILEVLGLNPDSVKIPHLWWSKKRSL